MQPCVYTTNHPKWLCYMREQCSPTDRVCFRSSRRWATAKRLMDRNSTLPILFRETKDDGDEFVCTYVAELVQISFVDDFNGELARRNWLNERLWLQRDAITQGDRAPGFRTWQEEFITTEVKPFMAARTYYTIRELRTIKPLPLPYLTKIRDEQPLSGKYIRGYSICYYPESEVEIVGATVA